jgi:hypothetical protein
VSLVALHVGFPALLLSPRQASVPRRARVTRPAGVGTCA